MKIQIEGRKIYGDIRNVFFDVSGRVVSVGNAYVFRNEKHKKIDSPIRRGKLSTFNNKFYR